jgi:hypothetical protein
VLAVVAWPTWRAKIAAVLGAKEKSVKVLLYRARVKEERILRGHEGHGFEENR